ncbi:tyrosine-type recombinase/integrase [Ectothiorhodospira variabilis]|uniref:tyrosine-type recombinase/integrase n=1 Tax=Ectothiorhodospira variabilis TaxID=505694 RepID=UPI001EFB4B0F|nr:integrase arm-type DNA-binding domain-containing protein [Ectothiorhodospira variabilis]MCG5494409.1 integrase arm-type DNA-binding domain-containing protein [Ectothiorhodospira variabilis]MCG5503220.1 integrase arm-type DNA-binding domain-containing protein [Ectothiorhodospira variabilis]MCG5506021.1 integrase arm-type DNA-binding domain-containing protein [Ectothiorhodospira variabilis]
MPKRAVPLTDSECRTARFEGRPRKLYDGGGLFLHIQEAGKYWRMRYRFQGREKLYAIGVYPQVSLKMARQRREAARDLLSQGVDPMAAKRQAKAQEVADATTLEMMARGWLEGRHWAEKTHRNVRARLETYILPKLGTRPIAEITAPDLLKILRAVEDSGASSTPTLLRGDLSRIFRHAQASGLTVGNPAEALRDALKEPPEIKHRAAVLDPARLARVLVDFDHYQARSVIVGASLRLLPLLLVRPGELRQMEWAEVDLDAALWSIPAAKMKMRADHLVPLPSQAVAILEALAEFTGNGRYAFPNSRSPEKPQSEMTMIRTIRRMGYGSDDLSAHGFRATARTLLDEVLKYRPDFIEHQLAHAVRDANGRAYNRTTFLDERREMLQGWADYLDGLKGDAAGGLS